MAKLEPTTIQDARHPRSCGARPRASFCGRTCSRGFAQHPIFLVVVLVVCVAGFLGYRYLQVSQHVTPVSATGSVSGFAANSPDSSRSPDARVRNATQNESTSADSGLQSFFARLFGDADDVTRTDSEHAYEVQQYSPAEHAEWVDTFYTQLYSPEVPATAAPAVEEAIPVISGRVLTQHGLPVGGIEVSAQFRNYLKDAESNAIQSAVGTQVTTTNEDGFYAFRGLPQGVYMISTPDAGSYAPSRIEVRTGVKYADLTLKTQRYAEVKGVVTDPMGNAIEGVHIMPLVKGIPAGTVSGEDGAFALAVRLQQGLQVFPMRFQANGFREKRYEVGEGDLTARNEMRIHVVMEPVHEFGTVSGQVKGADGLPAAGEIIRLYSPSLKRNYHATADSGGEYEFVSVEVADDYQLWVRPVGPYRDFKRAKLAVAAGHGWYDIELEQLNRDYRLSGRILDQNGNPIPNFTLTVRSKAASGQKLAVISDRHGRYAVSNVPEGDIVFESRTMPYYTVSGVRLSGAVNDRILDLIINRGQNRLLGKVVDSEGRPVASPRILISTSMTKNGLRSQSSSNTSGDYDGRFLFTDLSEGQHTVTVNAPGFKGVRLTSDVGNRRELVIELEESST